MKKFLTESLVLFSLICLLPFMVFVAFCIFIVSTLDMGINFLVASIDFLLEFSKPESLK